MCAKIFYSEYEEVNNFILVIKGDVGNAFGVFVN